MAIDTFRYPPVVLEIARHNHREWKRALQERHGSDWKEKMLDEVERRMRLRTDKKQ
jgi:hypothetical protein